MPIVGNQAMINGKAVSPTQHLVFGLGICCSLYPTLKDNKQSTHNFIYRQVSSDPLRSV